MVSACLGLGGRAFRQVIEYPHPYPYPLAYPGLQWGELPAKWVHEGYVRLCVAKGIATGIG